jgi:hypothetical protein
LCWSKYYSVDHYLHYFAQSIEFSTNSSAKGSFAKTNGIA